MIICPRRHDQAAALAAINQAAQHGESCRLMFVCVGSVGSENFADLLEQVFGNNRLMLRLVTDTLVNDLADVLRVGENVVDAATRVEISTKGLAGLGVVDLGTNPLAVERIGDLLAGLHLRRHLEDPPHQFSLLLVDHVLPIDDIKPKLRLPPDVLALAGGEQLLVADALANDLPFELGE